MNRFALSRLVGSVAAMAAACGNATPPSPPASCAATVPAQSGGPGTWLGECTGGKATGLGVLRIGAAAPFAFFMGQAAGGRPTSGIVMSRTGDYTVIRGLDGAGRMMVADGEHMAAQDRAWANAAAGARAVSRRFAQAGNAASAGYYATLAHKIEIGRPE